MEHIEGRLSDAQLTALLNHRRIAEWWDGAPPGEFTTCWFPLTTRRLGSALGQRCQFYRRQYFSASQGIGLSLHSLVAIAQLDKEVAQKWSQILERGLRGAAA